MLFWKAGQQTVNKKQGAEKDLYPVRYVTDSLKQYHTDLVHKEVESLWELNLVGVSFNNVMGEAENFQNKLEDLGQNFMSVNEASEQFVTVRDEIAKSVGQAQDEVEILKNSSMEVKKLADEIKDLAAEVDSGLKDVEQGTDKLSDSIDTSRQALGQSLDKVQETYNMFDKITQAAEGATAVHTQISGVIGESRTALGTLCSFFDKIKDQYQEVVKHISSASRLGTTKSAMFEDIDNLLSQIAPIIEE